MTKPITFHRAVCFFLCALLLFFLAMTVTRVAPEEETLFSFHADGGADTLPEDSLQNLRAEKTEKGLHCEAVGENPGIVYKLSAPASHVILTFAEQPEGSGPVLSMTKNDNWDAAVHVPADTVEVDENGNIQYNFYLSASNGYTDHAFRLGDDFTLISIIENEPSTASAYRFNLSAAILFAAAILLLVLLERRLGFFRELRDIFVRKINLIRSFAGKKRMIHVACISMILLYAAVAFADLMFSLTLPISAYLLWVLAVLAMIAVLVEGLVLRSDISFARMFFFVVAILGSAFALTIPPTISISWDDEFHFAYMAYPGSFITGGEMPRSAQQLIVQRPHFSCFFANTEQFTSSLLASDAMRISIPDLSTLTSPNLSPLTLVAAMPLLLPYAVYRYLVYVPGILVCAFGFLLGADFVLITTVCRLCILLLYVTLFAFAIRRLLYGKRLFALCALLPTALFLSVNFSCDPFITGWIALAFAYFIGELQRPNELLTKKNMWIMLIALAIGCGPKAIYFILFLPFLFLPKSKFRDRRAARRFRLITLGIAFVVMLTIIVPLLMDAGAYTDLRGGEDVSASGQIKHILSAPFTYAKVLFRFFASIFAFTTATTSCIFYAYMDCGGNFVGTAFLLLLFFVAAFDRTRKDSFDLSVNALPKTITFVSLFAAISLIATSLYVGFTPVGSTTIAGCQFRYFFPLFPIFFYFVGSVRLRSFISERALTVATLGGGVLANLIAIFDRIVASY